MSALYPLAVTIGPVIVGVLAFAAVAALAVGVLSHVLAGQNPLDRALRPYQDGGAPRPRQTGKPSLFESDLVQRGMERAARLAQLGPLLEWVETRLEQANVALRPPEALFLYMLGVAVFGGLAFFVGGLLPGTLVLLAFAVVPPAILSGRAKLRLRLFNSQLPDALILMASSLRAGYSFLQGVEAVSQEVRDPMAAELRRVMIEAQLGRPVEEALEDCAQRMKSADFEWAVRAVSIQREVGGNLSELLEIVAETMVDRERLRRDIRSLTAEGRMSAIVLGLLPPGVGLAFYVKSPDYIQTLFHNTGGKVALAAASVGMVGGFFWMNKVIQIDV